MQSLKIILTCVGAAVLYGIVHDQFTAHICVEYFSVFHPPVFSTTSPTLLALGWGVIATWWMGAFLGVLLAFAARAGSRNKIDVRELVRPISKLLVAVGFLATVAGLTGYVLASRGAIAPPSWVGSLLPPARHARFMADWSAHNASYFFGFFGGILLCILTIRKRRNSVVMRRTVDGEEQLKKTGKRILIGTLALLTLAALTWSYSQFGWMFYRYHSSACQLRGKAYEVRIETLKRDASERLRIGTPKEDVIRFFKENGLPVSLAGDEYEGTIYTDGCAPAGCGSDAALLGLRVKADSSGAVAGEPIVGAIYTNCL
jgi:hypothetical protein